MPSDDDIRDALRRYASGEVRPPDMAALTRRAQQRAQRQVWERGLAAAVVVLILVGVGVLALRTWSDPRMDEPIGPSPSPTVVPTPSATPTPTPTPDPTSFAVNQSAGANEGPVGGIGDTIAGLRVLSADISAVECPNGVPCPGEFTLEVENTTAAQGRWEVFVYVYFNRIATLGNSSRVSLDAGESATVTVTIDVSQDPSRGPRGTYTWNWSAQTLN